MSHFGKEMKRNVDERNISGVDNQVIKDNDDRLSMINSKDKKVRLPIELQQALHLSSRADVANVSLQANSKNSIGESLTLSPQSGDRNHEMHRLLDPRDHHHRKHNHDHNIRAEALSQQVNNNSCNSSTHVYNMNMLLADDRRYTPFVLPKSAWPILNSSMEEPVLFSSSILHGNPMPDQSFMSTAMPKTTPTLHSPVDLPDNLQQRSLPFNNHTNNTMQIIEGSLHNISSYHNDSNMNDPDYPYPCMPSYHNDSNMNDQDYPYPSMPSYSSYPTSPSLPAEESNHIDFFAVDGRGTDCGFYQRQYLQGDDQTAYMAYHNISQEQNWHNVMQQDGHQGVYTPSSQGMIPVMPISYPSNYHALNSMDWQTEHHLNVQQGWHVPIPSHSQPIPMYMNHSGTQQTMISLVEHNNHIALNNVLQGCLTEGLVSSLTTSTGSAGRQALRKPSSCKDSFWLSYTVEDDQVSDQFCGEGAGSWKMQQRTKGMGKPSNKRQTPDGEEDDQQHDYAPTLKRSTTWNCMSYSDTNPTIDYTLKPYNRSCAKASPKQEKQPARQGIANDPQSIAARHRRERISERLKILQQLVPNGSKVDLVTMLEKAINYVKFLQLQVKVLATDEYWPTPLNKVPKVVAMAKLADHSKETTMENVEKATETC